MEIFATVEDAHDARILCLCYCPRTNEIITGSEDGDIKIWAAADGSYVRTIKFHQGFVTGLAYSQQHSYLISCSVDTRICVWTSKGENLYVEPIHRPVHTMALDEARQRLLVSHSRGTVQIFSVLRPMHSAAQVTTRDDEKLLELVCTVQAHDDFVRSIVTSLTKYYSSGYDRSIVVYDTDDPRRTQRFRDVHEGGVTTLSRDESTGWLISGGFDRAVRVWLPDVGLLQELGGFGDTVTGVCFVPETKMFWVATNAPQVPMIDPPTALDVGEFAPSLLGAKATVGHAHGAGGAGGAAGGGGGGGGGGADEFGLKGPCFQQFHYIPETKCVVGIADYTNIFFWKHNPNTAEVLLRRHTDAVESVSIDRSRNSTVIYSGGADARLIRWEPKRLNHVYYNHEEIAPGLHKSAITALAVSGDGKWVVSGCEDGNLIFHSPHSVKRGQADDAASGTPSAAAAAATGPVSRVVVPGLPEGGGPAAVAAAEAAARRRAAETRAQNKADDDEWENIFDLDITQRNITALHQLRKPKRHDDAPIEFNLDDELSSEDDENGVGVGGGKKKKTNEKRGTGEGGNDNGGSDDGNDDDDDDDDGPDDDDIFGGGLRTSAAERKRLRKKAEVQKRIKSINTMVEDAYSDWSSVVVDYQYGMKSGHTRQISGCAFVSEDRAVTVSWDRSIRFWRMRPVIELVGIIEDAHEEEILGLVYCSGLGQFATCGADAVAKIWDLSTQRLACVLVGHGDTSASSGRGTSGTAIAARMREGNAGRASRSPSTARAQLRVSQIKARQREEASKRGGGDGGDGGDGGGDDIGGSVSSPHPSSSPNATSASRPNRVRTRIGGDKRHRSRGEVSMMAWNPVHKMWVTGSEDRTIRSWTRDGRCASVVHSRGDGVTALCVDVRHGWVVAANADHKIRVYDPLRSEVLRVYSGHSDFIASIRYVPDAHQYVSTSMDGQIGVWNGHVEAPPPEVTKPKGRREGPIDLTTFVPPEDRDDVQSDEDSDGSSGGGRTGFRTYHNAPKLSRSTRLRGVVQQPAVLTNVRAQVRGTLAAEMDFRPKTKADPAARERERRTERLNTLLDEVDKCLHVGDPEASVRVKIASKRSTLLPQKGLSFALPEHRR